MKPNYLFKTRRQAIARARRKHGLKDYKGALDEWNELIERNAEDSLAMLGKFDCLLKLGDKQSVLNIGDLVCEMNPDSQAAQNNFACLLLENREFEKAAKYFEHALALDDDGVMYHFNAGLAYRGAGQLDQAARSFGRVLEFDPGHERAIEFLSQIYLDFGLTREVIELSMRLRLLRTGYTLPLQRRLHCMHSDPKIGDAEKNADVSLLRTILLPASKEPSITFTGAEKKIGWMVCRFGLPILRYVIPLLKNHSASGEFEFVAFFNDAMLDREEIDILFDRYCFVDSMHPQKFQEAVLTDPVDVMIDVAGQVPNNFGHLYTKRLAPRQISWPMTHTPSEIALFDKAIVDHVVAPPKPSEATIARQSTNVMSIESRLHRLSISQFAYEPASSAPQISTLPSEKNDAITFGVIADLMKINQQSVDCWAEVLRTVKGSKILVVSSLFPASIAEKNILDMFLNAGINEKRIEFFTKSKDFHRRWECFHHIDIVVDPFPFGETLHNIDAMWMGCPVVMCHHQNHTSKLAQSVLIGAGKAEWIAPDRENYVKIIQRLSKDRDTLRDTRATLREDLKTSSITAVNEWAAEFLRLAVS